MDKQWEDIRLSKRILRELHEKMNTAKYQSFGMFVYFMGWQGAASQSNDQLVCLFDQLVCLFDCSQTVSAAPSIAKVLLPKWPLQCNYRLKHWPCLACITKGFVF